jgi:very-short-patch-repair endonuclease
MIINIESKITVWKNKLLDLGKRNRLLNYKETKRSSLQILAPDCISLWKSFVQDEKPLEFPYYDEFSIELEESSYSVQTNQTIKEMQKTLRSLRDKAKTANEEQGTNILYLSFGFLKWRETANSDYTYSSPIILVPVTLTVESIASPYILSLHEDEIVLNPTLCHKLENDFGITLPDFNEEIDIDDYLTSINELIANNQWEASSDVSLSLLSFLKINMFKDLEWHKEKIKQNTIVRAISGDTDACEKIPEELVDFDFDNNLKPTQVFQVVDADSSQMDAVLCAKRGISFVLQGPPGTGKSQTITNIISECLADGKKVLFVSEKMAALEVVHKRLTNAELDDFCLILHSHKAHKRAVLDQLGNVIKMAAKKVQLSDEAYQKLNALQSDRDKLNDYANQLVEKISPLDKSIFEANGILAHLDSYGEIIFAIENITQITKEQYNKQLYLLEQFSGTIGKMSENYSNNPWNGTDVEAVTNELRHDVGANLTTLVPKTSDATQTVQRIFNELTLQWKNSYIALQQLIPVLEIAKQSPIVPVPWITGNEITPLFDEITKCEQRKSLFLQKRNELKTEYESIFANDNSINDLDITNLSNTSNIEKETEKSKVYLLEFPYSNWKNSVSRTFSLFEETNEQATKLNDLHNIIVTEFENGIFDVDFQGIYNRYKTDYTSFFKVFKKSYREDKKAIQAQYKTIVKKVTDEMALNIIAKLRTHSELKTWFSIHNGELISCFGELYNAEKTNFALIKQYFTAFKSLEKSKSILAELHNITKTIEKEEHNLIAHYQFFYKGLNTEWEEIRKSLTWAANFRKQVSDNNLNVSFVESVCSNVETVKLCNNYSVVIQTILNDIDTEFQWFLSLFGETEKIKTLSLPALQDRLERCKNNLFLLEEWIDFRNARENCRKVGLNDYLVKIDELQIDRNNIIPCFKKRFFRLWLDAVLPDYPAVLSFRRRTHESTINEFAELDKLQFAIAKAIIKSKLIDNLPQMNHFTSGFDEIGILKREMNKQRKIMPVRKLFKAIPNLLLTLKPCLMMSPLSVSLFLEADTYMFDVVIFDEASQVCTENAIGAIFRGKQVIIAGDSKQLPPTNFFTASTSDIEFDTDDDEEDDSSAYESILDEANLLPERTLLWHYRSRHEHLIAFSNAKIYRNNLITFPSNRENTKDNGVEYVFVENGFYDRGGKSGNVPEAKKVAELVFEHFRKQPNRSLGVIAFGEVQQQAIDGEIRSMRLRNQQYEHFFNEDTNEPFFIKNLENVQGDERDTIIFSIGYAKDATGVFRMNFGPLSKSGGERRLNVAITRAKYNVKLVGSIMPTDIIIEKISSDGPKLLRSYIDFAINGADSLIRTTTENDFTWHDSPFEEAVYNFLDRKGYKVGTQVGCSGYRIDMAVKHPTLSGIYVLGIECDGAAYHSARTARERDRLRQDVLENMGWKIYRIWSTDWIKDPITEGEKLIAAINNAISNYGTFENSPLEDSEIDPDNFITEKPRTIDLEQQLNPYQFEEYKETSFSNLPLNSYGYLELTDCITEVVNNEFPVHYELLCQKLAHLYGNQKATVKVRREVDYALRKLGNNIYRRGDFFYPSKETKIVVKMPNTRTITHIAVEEIAAAMLKILPHCFGTNREGILSETRKVYGFGSLGANITTAMNAACDLLINSGKVKIVDEKIILVENIAEQIKTQEIATKTTCGVSSINPM